MKLTKEEFENTLESRVKENLSPIDTDELYDEILDEVNDEIRIGELTYSPSYVLKNVDEIAYNCGKNDYFGCSDEFTEIDGEYYKTDEVDEIREELENELEEKEELENN